MRIYPIVRRIAFGLVACMLASGGAAADALFRPANPAEAQIAAPRPAAGVLRTRLVQIDRAVLAASVAPLGVDRRRDRLERARRLGREIEIGFFPDVAATFRRSDIRTLRDGGFVWAGRAVGERGSATLVIVDGRVTGHAELGGRIFRIDPLAGDLHRIVEVDPAGEKPDSVTVPPAALRVPPARFAAGRQARALRSARTVVRVLVPYTNAAVQQSSNISQRIDLAIQLANEAYTASGANLQLQLAGKMQLAYVEGASFATNRSDLISGTRLATVRTRRNDLRADVVVLVRSSSTTTCGDAALLRDPSAPGSDAYAFAVVGQDCLDYHSLAHEIGHLMGLQHDRFVASPILPGAYNFGYVNTAGRVRDIMAYNDRCRAAGVTCTRVKMFSTPSRTYQGWTFGRAAGNADAADAARRLDETRIAVAAFR